MRRFALHATFVAAAAVALALPAMAQVPAAGAAAFAVCRTCHTIDKGGRNGVGPNLFGVFGRPAGAAAGFNYSAALKGSGLKWDAKTLDEFITAPARRVPGTRMPIGVADPAKRRAVIEYLKAVSAK